MAVPVAQESLVCSHLDSKIISIKSLNHFVVTTSGYLHEYAL